ncbi:MAG: hypothetical protein M2R45_00132 [Verrucomicrobia subdivision 3 bacterium]|nr:hypothetical protein [Limisphaerales bacterium]MCS1412408.1 hypothetical protein [Limisphaerales bacterium]
MRRFNTWKDDNIPWCRNHSQLASKKALSNFGAAIKRFLAKKGGVPRFKKYSLNDRFRVDSERHWPVSGYSEDLQDLRQNLNVHGMVRNRCSARGVLDVALGNSLVKLKVKIERYGAMVTEVAWNFPSSKSVAAAGMFERN